MVNSRVSDLDAMVAQLKAAGAAVDDEIEVEAGAGRFVWLRDPEGNKVQLWQPEDSPEPV
jgi:glyoxylase I family protein